MIELGRAEIWRICVVTQTAVDTLFELLPEHALDPVYIATMTTRIMWGKRALFDTDETTRDAFIETSLYFAKMYLELCFSVFPDMKAS